MYSGQPGRPELTGGANSIQRNRDGVPKWSGETVLFEEYVEACLLYEQTVAREKRYLCGPRLASELKLVGCSMSLTQLSLGELRQRLLSHGETQPHRDRGDPIVWPCQGEEPFAEIRINQASRKKRDLQQLAQEISLHHRKRNHCRSQG